MFQKVPDTSNPPAVPTCSAFQKRVLNQTSLATPPVPSVVRPPSPPHLLGLQPPQWLSEQHALK